MHCDRLVVSDAESSSVALSTLLASLPEADEPDAWRSFTDEVALSGKLVEGLPVSDSSPGFEALSAFN